MKTKTIDWNQMSELGLIVRINKEILHPLGLALSRNTETGSSDAVLVADDGAWEYSKNEDLPNFDIQHVKATLDEIKKGNK